MTKITIIGETIYNFTIQKITELSFYDLQTWMSTGRSEDQPRESFPLEFVCLITGSLACEIHCKQLDSKKSWENTHEYHGNLFLYILAGMSFLSCIYPAKRLASLDLGYEDGPVITRSILTRCSHKSNNALDNDVPFCNRNVHTYMSDTEKINHLHIVFDFTPKHASSTMVMIHRLRIPDIQNIKLIMWPRMFKGYITHVVLNYYFDSFFFL